MPSIAISRSLPVMKANGTDVVWLARAFDVDGQPLSPWTIPYHLNGLGPSVEVGNDVEENLVVHDFQLPYERDVGEHFVGAV